MFHTSYYNACLLLSELCVNNDNCSLLTNAADSILAAKLQQEQEMKSLQHKWFISIIITLVLVSLF